MERNTESNPDDMLEQMNLTAAEKLVVLAMRGQVEIKETLEQETVDVEDEERRSTDSLEEGSSPWWYEDDDDEDDEEDDEDDEDDYVDRYSYGSWRGRPPVVFGGIDSRTGKST